MLYAVNVRFMLCGILCYNSAGGFSVKVLLVAINASYMHTSLAVRSIYNYVINNSQKKNDLDICFKEFTINQKTSEIMRGIAESHADMVMFSTYIWNVEVIEKIIPDVKKILPACVLGAGGPEFGYAPDFYMNKFNCLDFVIAGEGESAVFDIVSCGYKNCRGVYFRDNDGGVVFGGVRELIFDLDTIPFAYPELCGDGEDLYDKNKIYYYESSRGCPYNCSYCLSSIDKSVRFKTLEKVYSELQIFLDADVNLVKFVDRTYNLKPERYIKIWQYILEHHNGHTMFHFEIEAEYLSEDALEFLQKVPCGVMQFEIGVQSANKQTLRSINRSDNIELLYKNVKRIPRTIHQHLDLIAGLPFEDLQSFGKSFDFVMQMKPDALQIGFLKVLHGTQMEKFASENGWQWQQNAVYETFSTPYMSFTDMSFIKDVEILVDEYWNKALFIHTMNFIFKTVSPWSFFYSLCEYARAKNVFDAARRDLFWFNLLHEFFYDAEFEKLIQSARDNSSLTARDNIRPVLQEYLRYDFVLSGKKGNFPSWYVHRYDKEKHRALLEQKEMLHSTRLAFATTEFETFDFDVTKEDGFKNMAPFETLIVYPSR